MFGNLLSLILDMVLLVVLLFVLAGDVLDVTNKIYNQYDYDNNNDNN